MFKYYVAWINYILIYLYLKITLDFYHIFFQYDPKEGMHIYVHPSDS